MGGIVPKNQDKGILEFGAGGTSTRLVFILLMGNSEAQRGQLQPVHPRAGARIQAW